MRENTEVTRVRFTVGTILTILSVLFLFEAVQLLDLDFENLDGTLYYWRELLVYLFLGGIFGSIGISMVTKYIESKSAP